ncbi:MAG: hypothetical protein ACREOZ_03900 [Gloeomargaritales cyanobacterium]
MLVTAQCFEEAGQLFPCSTAVKIEPLTDAEAMELFSKEFKFLICNQLDSSRMAIAVARVCQNMPGAMKMVSRAVKCELEIR